MPTYDKDLHLIQFEMLINKNNKDIVHHYDVHECDNEYIHTQNITQECNNVALPQHVNQNCQGRLFVAWAVGGQ